MLANVAIVVGHHVVAVEILGDLLVDGVVPNVALRALVPRSGGEKPSGDDRLRVVGKEHVARDLLLQQSGRKACPR